MSLQLSKPLEYDGSFTEEDAEINFALVNPEIYPHLYGDKLFKPLKLHSRSVLMPVASITLPPLGEAGANKPWAGEKNPLEHEIGLSLKKGGMKFKYPPLAVYLDKQGKYRLFDGRTRWTFIVDEFSYINVIVDIYHPDYDNYSDFEIDDAIDKFPRSANFQGRDAAGKLKMEDLFHGIVYAIEMGWIPKDNNGRPIQEFIEKRLDEITGSENSYSTIKFQELVYRVLNSAEESPTTRYWKNKESVKTFCSNLKNPLKDKTAVYDKKGDLVEKGIIYYYFETSSFARAKEEAAQVAYDNPDYEIRIVIYPKALKSLNLSENFWTRINAFKDFWDAGFSKLANVYWRGRGPYHDRVRLYAAVPSLAKDHDLNRLLFLQSDGTWKQKT